MIDYKVFRLKKLEIKSTDQGRFDGWLSVFGNVDEQREVVEAGAFAKTLGETGKFPLLWHHDQSRPVGDFRAQERERGLWIEGRLLIDRVQQAREAYELMREGITKGLSIGYRVVKDEMRQGVRHLKELRLLEGSLVTLPANPLATVTGVKSEVCQAELAALEEILRAADAALFQTMRTGK